MKRFCVLLFFANCFFITALSQGSLQFSQVKIISDTEVVVPQDKVWKVTAIYGGEWRHDECVDMNVSSSHELGVRVRCALTFSFDFARKFSYFISGFMVNGVPIVSKISGLNSSTIGTYWHVGTNCTGTTNPNGSYGSTLRDWSCANQISDPNLLPVWLPENTTIKSLGPNTFISIIEFNII